MQLFIIVSGIFAAGMRLLSFFSTAPLPPSKFRPYMKRKHARPKSCSDGTFADPDFGSPGNENGGSNTGSLAATQKKTAAVIPTIVRIIATGVLAGVGT